MYLTRPQVPERIHAQQQWSPPFPDAADVIIRKIIDPATVEPRNGFSEDELVYLREKQRFALHHDEEFTGFPSKGEFNLSASGTAPAPSIFDMDSKPKRKRRGKKRRSGKRQPQDDSKDFEDALSMVEAM